MSSSLFQRLAFGVGACLMAVVLVTVPAFPTAKTLVDTDSTQTLTNKTLVSPTISTDVSGGASYPSIILEDPRITGIVPGNATYSSIDLTSPDISGTLTARSGVTMPAFTAGGTISGTTGITSVGTITTGTWTGTKIGLAPGGTNADLSATGGANFVLQQSSVGAAITSAALTLANLPANSVRVVIQSYLLSTASGTVTITHGGSTTPIAAALLIGRSLGEGTGPYSSIGFSNASVAYALTYGRAAGNWNVESSIFGHAYQNVTTDRVSFEIPTFSATTVAFTATKTGSPTDTVQLILMTWF